jgi:predicted Zn-dependent peptidase
MTLNIKSQTDLSGFYVVYNRTIINEKPGIYGISHFIEHLISHSFNDDLVEEFQNVGMTWNAYTSQTNIVFYLNGLDKYVLEYRNKFLDKLSYIDINKTDFEVEKSVLLIEYSSLFNMQSSSHLLNLYRKLFNSYSAIGRKEDIEKITLDDCVNHFNNYYSKPSKIINVSKNNPFMDNIEFNNFKNDYHFKYNINNNPEIVHHNRIKNKSSVIYLSPIIESDWDVVFFINYLLSNGINSPLYMNVRKKSGLAYYIRFNLERLSDYSGLNIITTETDDDKVDRLIESIDDTLINSYKFLNKSTFNQVKNSILNKIHTVDINRYCNVETYIKPKEWSIESNIENITLDKVIDTYSKYYNIDNFYKSVDRKEF